MAAEAGLVLENPLASDVTMENNMGKRRWRHEARFLGNPLASDVTMGNNTGRRRWRHEARFSMWARPRRDTAGPERSPEGGRGRWYCAMTGRYCAIPWFYIYEAVVIIYIYIYIYIFYI